MAAAAGGQAPGEVATAIVQARMTLELALPLLPHMAEVYGEIIEANAGAERVLPALRQRGAEARSRRSRTADQASSEGTSATRRTSQP